MKTTSNIQHVTHKIKLNRAKEKSVVLANVKNSSE